MEKVEILVNDGLIDFMTSKQSDIVHVQSNTPGEYKYKIYNLSSDDIATIEQFDGDIVEHDEISINKERAAIIEGLNNYNSIAFNNVIKNNILAESSIKSIYELYSQTDAFNRSAFLSPNSYIWTSFIQNNIISLHPNLSFGTIVPNKLTFPNVVDFLFNDSGENILLKFLNTNNFYQGFIDGLVRTNFDSETKTTTMGNFDFRTTYMQDVMSNISTSPSDYAHHQVYDSDSVRPREYTNLDQIFVSQELKSISNDQFLKPRQIINNEVEIYKEVICYKVEKYRENENSIYQTFYIPANEGYMDTQVIFGKKYTYRVYAIMAVFAPTYRYQVEAYGTTGEITIEVTNNVKLFNIDLLTSDINIKASAPTKPTVLFFNESNNEKKLRFYFEPGYHEEAEVFIPIESSDPETQLFAEEDKSTLMKKLLFKPNRDFLSYEIYKLNQRPMSYEDFRGSLFANVVNRTPANSETFEMFLTPNRKFYFLFRCKNGYGLYSNPTAVYEVELIQDADETRVAAKAIKLPGLKTKRTKSFGRFIRIYPSMEQLLVREHSDSLDGAQLINTLYGGTLTTQGDDEQPETFLFDNRQFYLGMTESPIWGRKFKIRVKSNNTGKIVDLNVEFILNKKDSEEDFS